MTKDEYQKWVDYVIKNGLKPPRAIVEGQGYDDWRSRIMLARFLCRNSYRQLEPAIKLYKSVLDIKVTALEDVEQKAWAMQDLGLCIWYLLNDARQALHYIDMAVNLAESVKGEFYFIARGELWLNRWQLLSKLGEVELAIKEADEIILSKKLLHYKNNSYLYYAYKFKAENELNNNNLEQAVNFLKHALSFFPHENDSLQKLDEIWNDKSQEPSEIYTAMNKLTTKVVYWDI